MEVVGDLSALDRRRPIAFLPTMGALHQGHAVLISKAREYSTNVVVSIFVNPLQFEDPDDLAKYPRAPEADAEFAARYGATTVWFPTRETLYREGFENISATPEGEIFEGGRRKHHFAGVLTAVHALFHEVGPRWAFFGEKDFQQLFLVKQMVRTRGMGIEIVAVPTVRDIDGLALSSRNLRLTSSDREAALVISRALRQAVNQESLVSAQRALTATLEQEPRFTVDYAAIIDEETFSLANNETRLKRVIVAGWVSGVRLIDNMAMTSVEQ